MNLNEPEDSLQDFFCDTTPQDSNPSPIDRIADITDESRDSTNQSYPSFSYGHTFPDPGMIDEDTRHSVGSFQDCFKVFRLKSGLDCPKIIIICSYYP